MSMHLVGPYMTTTQYNRKKKKPNAKQARANVEHEKWLRKKGIHPEQLEAKKKKNADISILSVPDYSTSRPSVPTSDAIPCGNTPQKERNIYSGERQLLGVATMHKSNMVPVFADKKEDAKDIASMRR